MRRVDEMHLNMPFTGSRMLGDLLARYGKSEIFNTDQGSQFISLAFTSVLEDHDIRIPMDSKGCWGDNVFVARLWRTIKYEEIYLRA